MEKYAKVPLDYRQISSNTHLIYSSELFYLCLIERKSVLVVSEGSKVSSVGRLQDPCLSMSCLSCLCIVNFKFLTSLNRIISLTQYLLKMSHALKRSSTLKPNKMYFSFRSTVIKMLIYCMRVDDYPMHF